MNIENFGKDDNNTDNQFAIAEHFEMSGVDVLALQELHRTNDISNPNTAIENEFLQAAIDLIEEHTGQKWEYEIFRNRSPNDTSQLCGVVWNTSKVEKVGETLRLGVKHIAKEGSLKLNLWDRHPHAVKFKARPGETPGLELTDFVIVSLHMKSNVGKRHIVMRTRYHEARELMEQLHAIKTEFGEKDIILLGDTNCKGRNEDAVQEFVKHGFEDLNEDDVPTYYRGESAPFDRIFVPADRKPFLYSRQYFLRSASPLAHDRFLSDHYMVKTSIVIRKDEE
jgi:predicted extracellular nuclease